MSVFIIIFLFMMSSMPLPMLAMLGTYPPETSDRAFQKRRILASIKPQYSQITVASVVTVENNTSPAPCILRPRIGAGTEKLKTLLQEKVKLIRFVFNLKDFSITDSISNDFLRGRLYKPFQWMRVFDAHGSNLLLLRHNFDVVSLFTLSIGTDQLKIELTQEPDNCMAKWTEMEFENYMRMLVLNNLQVDALKNESLKNYWNDNICNMYIREKAGLADFYFTCCVLGSDRNFNCHELTGNEWLGVLFVIIFAIKIFMVLYSPRLLPITWHNQGRTMCTYVHHMNGDPLKVKVLVTSDPKYHRHSKPIIAYKEFCKMEKLKESLNEIHKIQKDTMYCLEVKSLHFEVRQPKLLSDDFVFLGFFKVMYNMFVKCKLAQTESMRDVCQEELCSPRCSEPCRESCGTKRVTIVKCCKEFMRLVLIILFIIPWVFRVLIFYMYEEEEMTKRRQAADRVGLSMGYFRDITLTLSPLHVLFMIMYICLGLESFLIRSLSTKLQNKLQGELRQSFREMREISTWETIKRLLSHAFKFPRQFKGFCSFIQRIVIVILLSPFLLIVLCFLIFPTLNLTWRLFVQFLVYLIPRRFSNCAWCLRLRWAIQDPTSELGSTTDLRQSEDDFSNKNRLLQVVLIIISLFSVYSIILLLTEVVSYIAEMLVYTLIGIILNAGKTLTYLTFIFLLIMYAQNAFESVSKRYSNFNKKLHDQILKKCDEKEVEKVANMDECQQENTAFQINIHSQNQTESKYGLGITLSMNQEGLLQWNSERVLLFLDKSDTRYIPMKFFENVAKQSYHGCPGEILPSYFKAIGELGIVVAFLGFVVVIVLAFSDAYQISSTNSMLATLAGGAVPWLLRTFVFQSPPDATIDTSSFKFATMLNNVINSHSQMWPVRDMEVKIAVYDQMGHCIGPRISRSRETCSVDSPHQDSVECSTTESGVHDKDFPESTHLLSKYDNLMENELDPDLIIVNNPENNEKSENDGHKQQS